MIQLPVDQLIVVQMVVAIALIIKMGGLMEEPLICLIMIMINLGVTRLEMGYADVLTVEMQILNAKRIDVMMIQEYMKMGIAINILME